jgi:hypothetical protein
MVGDAIELAQDYADVLSSLRNFDFHELLDGHTKREFTVEVGYVVQSVEQGDDLAVLLVFEELLGAAMEVAYVRLGANDAFAVDPDNQAKHPVSRRVLGAHVDQNIK